MNPIPADDPRHPAYGPVEDQSELPRILLIGDSISIGYTVTVREILNGAANVHRVPENGRDTEHGLKQLDAWLGEKPWDLIHFNFGLHDIRHVKDDMMDISGIRIRSVDEYAQNLTRILDCLNRTGARLIFATTTPVPNGADGRRPGDEIESNAIAGEIMAGAGVPINDLHAFITPRLAEAQTPQNVHFNEHGYRLLGEEVARIIRGLFLTNRSD
ncbi:MAG: SGNH/GDSL hydrolase family protein [Verrucomicrobia bacterium]|nr:MAG: SGNH/GDSL hydrolase family protein [Verrucomicrobiota bacterium]